MPPTSGFLALSELQTTTNCGKNEGKNNLKSGMI